MDIQEKKRVDLISKYWSSGKTSVSFVVGENKKLLKDEENSTHKVFDLLKREYSQKFDSVIEFAAGMGRLTKNVLLKHFNLIDVEEPSLPLLNEIKKLKKSKISGGKINKLYSTTAEKFEFERNYDLIFLQWLLENLNDLDVIKFLLKAKKHLNPKGRIFLKDNLQSEKLQNIEFSNKGQKVRQRKALLFLFELCGFRIALFKVSDDYPSNYKQSFETLLEIDDGY